MRRAAAAAGLLMVALPWAAAQGHGIVGPRFFPATIATDDPFAADELALPTISIFRHLDDGVPVTETEYSMEYSKSIFPGFAISFGEGYVHAKPDGAPSASGFDNLEVTPILQVARSEEHEFIASLAFSWEVGGTGSRSIGAEAASGYTPKIEFGKGFGDLPDSAAWLRPFAVTGLVGYGIPGSHDEPHTIEWGGALEYSLSYLQTNVRDVGLGPFLSRLTPVVEFSLSSPLDRDGGPTTGTIDPGVIWSGQQIQLGVEAILPVNHATGSNIGAIAQLHFYLDDIFPHSLGRPLFP
ncbi:MAG TPA: hypothetical protein VLC74_03670 [Rhizomicrobium sp.]|nr:hypothetical protein [Rhizomicrobium sp.]